MNIYFLGETLAAVTNLDGVMAQTQWTFVSSSCPPKLLPPPGSVAFDTRSVSHQEWEAPEGQPGGSVGQDTAVAPSPQLAVHGWERSPVVTPTWRGGWEGRPVLGTLSGWVG